MKKYFIFVLILFLSAGTIFAQKKLTLKEAINIALQKNTTLIKTSNSLKSSKAAIKSAYGRLLPNLSVSGSWNWSRINDKGGTQIDFLGNEKILPASQVDTRNYSLRAGGGVTLFDGLSNFANIHKSKDTYEAAKYTLERLKQNIVYKTIELYYSVISAKELLKVRKENVNYNKKLLEDIMVRNKLGAVAIADVYTQKVQYGNAQVQYINQKNVYENAKSNLLDYLAIDVLADYDLENPFKNVVKVDTKKYLTRFDNVKAMVGKALNNRYDYFSQKLTLNSRYEDLTIAKSGFYPTLSANYGLSTNALKTSSLFDRKVWSAGLSLQIPIFSNFRTSTNIQVAKVGIENSKEDLTALERQIKIQIKQGWLDLLASKEALQVSYENVKSSLENRKINDERYRLGSATILDVLQSARDYQNAESSKINAEFNFYKLSDKLLNLMGLLDYKQYVNVGDK